VEFLKEEISTPVTDIVTNFKTTLDGEKAVESTMQGVGINKQKKINNQKAQKQTKKQKKRNKPTKKTIKQTIKQTNKQTTKQTNQPTNKQTNKQMDDQSYKKTHTQ